MSFLANVMLKQPRVWGSKASLGQKSRSLRAGGFIPKTFPVEHVLFSGHLVDIFSYLPVKRI